MWGWGFLTFDIFMLMKIHPHLMINSLYILTVLIETVYLLSEVKALITINVSLKVSLSVCPVPGFPVRYLREHQKIWKAKQIHKESFSYYFAFDLGTL